MELPTIVDQKTLNKKKNRQYIEATLKNRELLQSTMERKQSLLLHSGIVSNPEQQLQQNGPIADLIRQNKKLMNEYLNSHTYGLGVLAKQLIDAQIRIQKQSQMMSLIKQYEDRVSELREYMINKEIELCIQLKGRKMNFMPTKDRVRELNIAEISQRNLRKMIREYEQLKESVEQMQKQMREIGTISEISIEDNRFALGNPSKSIDQERYRRKYQAFGQDKVLQKVFNLLMNQTQEEQRLKVELENLYKKIDEAQKSHQQEVARYKQTQVSTRQGMLEQQE